MQAFCVARPLSISQQVQRRDETSTLWKVGGAAGMTRSCVLGLESWVWTIKMKTETNPRSSTQDARQTAARSDGCIDPAFLIGCGSGQSTTHSRRRIHGQNTISLSF